MSLLDLVPNSPSVALITPRTETAVQKDVSYAALRAQVLQLRDILRQKFGVQKGQVVAISIVNSVEYVVAFIATGASR